MGDFLQLKGKRRIKDDGLLDIIGRSCGSGKGDSGAGGTKLKEKVQDWLVQDNYLDDSISIINLIKPEVIGEVIMRRMCAISGHLWIEFAENIEDADEGDLINGGTDPHDEGINAYVVEFIPKGGEELFGSHNLPPEQYGIDWDSVTDEYLCLLFSHLLEASGERKRQPGKPRPGGATALLPGTINLLSPAETRQQRVSWFKDRANALTTPKWHVSEPRRVFEHFKAREDEKVDSDEFRYSFTPEHYDKTHNCVTWACLALREGWKIDWPQSIEAHFNVDTARLADKGCGGYDVREMGRMSCAIEYIRAADEQARQNGLTTFPGAMRAHV
jgi:hypothetical protein